MSGSENFGEKADVWMSNEECHGICKGIPCYQHTSVRGISPIPMNVSTRNVQGPSISQNRKAKMKKQLLDMLRESCILLEKSKLLAKQSEVLLTENSKRR